MGGFKIYGELLSLCGQNNLFFTLMLTLFIGLFELCFPIFISQTPNTGLFSSAG